MTTIRRKTTRDLNIFLNIIIFIKIPVHFQSFHFSKMTFLTKHKRIFFKD